MLLLYALPVGVLLGLAFGGKVARLAAARIRLAPLALAGLAFQVLLFSSPLAVALASAGGVGPALYVGSTVAVLVALVANLGSPGFRVILLGATLNLTAIVANGGYMPASPEAWAALHGTAGLPTDVLTNSLLAGPGTPLAFLGDIFYLPRPIPLANVFSIGDVLIAVGGSWFIARTMVGAATPRMVPRAAPTSKPVAAHG